jgi:hypothetical protein
VGAALRDELGLTDRLLTGGIMLGAELELADGLALGESLGEELGLAEGGALGEELGGADGLAKGKVLKEELIWSYAPPFLLEQWFWPHCYTLLHPKSLLAVDAIALSFHSP